MPSGGRPFGSHTAATSFGIERRPLGPHDVLLDVLDCGVCAGVTGNDLVKTRTSCELAEISYERLFQLFQTTLRDECARILFAIGGQLTNRLLHTSRKVSRLAFMDVTGRVSRTLVDLCEEPDAISHPKGTQIRISRQEISRIVGCSREMVGRVLKQLEEQGMISVSGKTIVVFGTR